MVAEFASAGKHAAPLKLPITVVTTLALSTDLVVTDMCPPQFDLPCLPRKLAGKLIAVLEYGVKR